MENSIKQALEAVRIEKTKLEVRVRNLREAELALVRTVETESSEPKKRGDKLPKQEGTNKKGRQYTFRFKMTCRVCNREFMGARSDSTLCSKYGSDSCLNIERCQDPVDKANRLKAKLEKLGLPTPKPQVALGKAVVLLPGDPLR